MTMLSTELEDNSVNQNKKFNRQTEYQVMVINCVINQFNSVISAILNIYFFEGAITFR